MTPIKKETVKNNFVELFTSNACNVSECCKKVGISRNTFYEWKKYDKSFAERIKEAEEGLIDFAESMLYKGIKEGKTTEIIFFLKTKGKSRGYVEKTEYEVNTQQEPDLSDLSTEDILAIIDDESTTK
jgi:transposase-like protein